MKRACLPDRPFSFQVISLGSFQVGLTKARDAASREMTLMR